MKLNKRRVYDALYISDIHFFVDKNIKDHAHKDLFDLLRIIRKRKVRFKRIVLGGDIIENWFFSAEKRLRTRRKQLNKLFNRLDRICSPDAEKIYLVGNHDAVRYDMRLPPRIERYLKARGWAVRETFETAWLVAVHGHQGQYGRLFWFANIVLLRILYALARIFPSFYKKCDDFYRKHFNFDRHNTVEDTAAYYSRLSRAVRQGDRLMISGHTHQFLHLPEFRAINTGDWIESRTFVVESDGTFLGLRYAGGKDLIREFKYRHPGIPAPA